MLHWWRYIAARRNQTCWIYLSLVFSHLMEYSTALKRNQNVLTMLHHSCTHSEGRARCPQQCLGWWREFFIKCTNWPETRQAAGLADSPPLVEATHRLWLLGVTVCCVHLVNGLRSLLGQERWIWQNRGGFTEIQEGVQHHWPQNRKRTMLIQPGHCSLIQILKARCGNHPIERLKQWLNNNAENPKLPILQRPGSHILIKHTPQVVKSLSCDENPGSRELLLTRNDGGIQLLDFFPKAPGFLLHLGSFLL